MQYREFTPNAAAGRFVRCYWVLDDDGSVSTPQRIVPDGRSELILNLGQPYEGQTGAGWAPQRRCFLVGQITGPLLVRPGAGGPSRMLGIRFHPHGASQLLGLPMCEITDAAVPLEDISRRLLRQLTELEELLSPRHLLRQWITPLNRIVYALGERTGKDDRPISRAVRELELAGGRMTVRDVADHAGLSSRQFERRFRDAVGIPPKLFCRMQRFQKVFRVIEDPSSAWVDAAVQCGYYDQAHLIRDFREFAGKPPAALLAEETDLARHFVKYEALSHFSKTTADGSC